MDNTIGSRIRACRKEMGYSQETLAEMLYMKKTTIYKYEKNQHDIPSSVIVQMSKVLNTTPNYLLLGEQEKKTYESTVVDLLREIKDEKLKELAMVQLKCIANV